MRLFLFSLALVLLAGCDTFAGSSGDTALMSRLDGVWTRAITTERVASDGTVTQEGTPRIDAYEIGRVVRCASTTFENTSESDRIAVSYNPASPDVGRSCSVITADGDARRLIFVGEGGTIISDVAATIDEDTASRQVWSFYRFDGADAVRTLWTLTR